VQGPKHIGFAQALLANLVAASIVSATALAGVSTVILLAHIIHDVLAVRTSILQSSLLVVGYLVARFAHARRN
jgi:hypothetical protein